MHIEASLPRAKPPLPKPVGLEPNIHAAFSHFPPNSSNITEEDWENLRYQIGISSSPDFARVRDAIRSRFVSASKGPGRNSSQSAISSRKHRELSYRPYAFTEQGIAMLSSVLRLPQRQSARVAC
jgi:ORF6N domain